MLLRVVLFLIIGPVGAASSEPFEPIAPDHYREFNPDHLKSSSDLVIGAVFAGTEPLGVVPRFQAKLKDDAAGTEMCLRTTSVDGFYQGEYRYTVPATWFETRILDFEYPTDYSELVSSPPGDTLAVAAFVGSCDTDAEEIYVGFWNTQESSSTGDVILTLNSVGGTAAFVFVGDDPSAEAVACESVDAARTTGFDFTCLLPIPPDAAPLVSLEIQIRRGSTRDSPRSVLLRIVR